MKIYEWIEVPIWTATITEMNFESPDPLNDSVTVEAKGPWPALLIVTASSEEGPPISLFEQQVNPGSHLIAFHPGGAAMEGTWTAVTAAFGASPQATGSITPPVVNTQNIVVVSWVDGSVISFPGGANADLVNNLNGSLTCPSLLGAWVSSNPKFLYNQTDRSYANAWLVKNSANGAPPGALSPSIMQSGDYRMFNVLQASFRRPTGSPVYNVRIMTAAPIVGTTPDPCGFAPAQSPQLHASHAAYGVAGGSQVYRLSEGRLGSDGQSVNLTINQRTTPWIWTVIAFGGPTGALSDYSVFPKHTVYVNGSQVSSTTPDLATFISYDDSYQFVP